MATREIVFEYDPPSEVEVVERDDAKDFQVSIFLYSEVEVKEQWARRPLRVSVLFEKMLQLVIHQGLVLTYFEKRTIRWRR